jgi:hypothetical protein
LEPEGPRAPQRPDGQGQEQNQGGLGNQGSAGAQGRQGAGSRGLEASRPPAGWAMGVEPAQGCGDEAEEGEGQFPEGLQGRRADARGA